MRKGGLVFYVLLFSLTCAAQTALTPSTGPTESPTRSIKFGRPRDLTAVADFAMLGYPNHCSPNGETYLQMFGLVGDTGRLQPFPTVFRYTSEAESRKVELAPPPGFEMVTVRDFFAGARTNAVLLLAQNTAKDLPPGTRRSAFYLSTMDSDGSHAHLYELDLRFEPFRLAVLDSGDLVVLGIDSSNVVPVLALLHDDGTYWKPLDLDNRVYDSSRELRTTGPVQTTGERMAQAQLSRVLKSAQFVPYGNKVLLVQPNSTLPLQLIGENGLMEQIAVVLPKGFLLEGALASDDPESLVLRLRTVLDVAEMTVKGRSHALQDKLALFDRRTGKLRTLFEVEGVLAQDVNCAVHHEMTAIHFVNANAGMVDVEGKPLPMKMKPQLWSAPLVR